MKYFLFAALFLALSASVDAYVVLERPSYSHVYYEEGPHGMRYSRYSDYDYRYTYTVGYREPGRCVGNGCSYTYSYGDNYRQHVRYNNVYNRINGNYRRGCY